MCRCGIVAFSAVAVVALSGVGDTAEPDKGRIPDPKVLAEWGPKIRAAAYEKDSSKRENQVRELKERFASAGAQGGGVQADFDALIELITTTIEPESWEDLGGPGTVQEFQGAGVYVNPSGLMKPLAEAPSAAFPTLAEVRDASVHELNGDNTVHQTVPLRKISLPRLEQSIRLLAAIGIGPSEAMRNLAGMTRIEYILVYPETGDLVLAGPAGDWRKDEDGSIVSVDGGKPVIQLDDLVLMLRNNIEGGGRFGCSITPRQEKLAQTQRYIDSTSRTPLRPSTRKRWLDGLRDNLGYQDISIYGIDPRTRAARVIVEADYHMKLIGMGLADGVLGVESYLDTIDVRPNEPPPGLGVLRWWFTLNYEGFETTPSRDAYRLIGPGVRVMSENELLAKTGKRIHTGQSDELNLRFAHSFTRHFDALSRKYPIYAQLRNVFDLAMLSAVVHAEGLATQVGWKMEHFLDDDAYRLGSVACTKRGRIRHQPSSHPRQVRDCRCERRCVRESQAILTHERDRSDHGERLVYNARILAGSPQRVRVSMVVGLAL